MLAVDPERSRSGIGAERNRAEPRDARSLPGRRVGSPARHGHRPLLPRRPPPSPPVGTRGAAGVAQASGRGVPVRRRPRPDGRRRVGLPRPAREGASGRPPDQDQRRRGQHAPRSRGDPRADGGRCSRSARPRTSAGARLLALGGRYDALEAFDEAESTYAHGDAEWGRAAVRGGALGTCRGRRCACGRAARGSPRRCSTARARPRGSARRKSRRLGPTQARAAGAGAEGRRRTPPGRGRRTDGSGMGGDAGGRGDDAAEVGGAARLGVGKPSSGQGVKAILSGGTCR